jgi:hypothetical protein
MTTIDTRKGPDGKVVYRARIRRKAILLKQEPFDRPAFLVHAHDLARCQLGQIGHQDFCMLGAVCGGRGKTG